MGIRISQELTPYGDNQTARGYLAMPEHGQGPGVLVIHPWWGLNDTIKGVCTRLAEAGFIAFAPDLYHGQVTDKIAEAEKLSSALFKNMAQARVDVKEAAKFLGARAGQERGLAVIGFSMGAYYAVDLSVADPEHICSVVLFYGAAPMDVSQSRAAYLGHFAENDPYEPESNVAELEESLRRAGRPVTFYRYPGTEHWFFEPDRPQYNKAAASLAWERTLTFLRNPLPSDSK